MANMPALQTGIAGDQIQEAWLVQHPDHFLVSPLPVFIEHFHHVYRLRSDTKSMNSDNILLLGLKCSVTAISRNDGRILWKTELSGGLNNSFVTVLSDGHHVFAHSGGSLYCLDLANGQILWSNELSGYGYGIASLCFPRGGTAPDPGIVEKIVSDQRSST